ncbi:DNA polymerase III subunit chi [Pelomonas sp. APW6]|uniref:DNA polymerase III subunit chi n=1 Tax=Roseateles subflavus TaxID=3053353 RepID=A0ABT7LLZ4_9BURK|nr:DNA polymerase III subunit chi [Pelomonas sp. APW6]MDL5033890.1 DNA polymerase III subunit chi [Pelomonas sp. APW6]
MAVEVTFYTGVSDRLHFATRLLRKAYGSGAQVLVLGPASLLARLDAALWTQDPTDFIPHVLAREGVDAGLLRATPLVLAERQDAAPHCRTVLNLGADFMADVASLDRVLEVLSSEPEQVQAGRRRYKAYREMGLDIKHHEVNA